MTPSKNPNQQEIADLLSKMRITHDSTQRAKLADEVNTLQSPIIALPPEILSIIFQYAFLVPRKALYRAISLVSKRWHSLLINTPELWTTIDLDIVSPRSRLSLIPFMTRSGDGALSVTLRFRGRMDGMDEETLVDRNVDPTILKNFTRIEDLNLTNPPLAWFLKLQQLQNMKRLTLKSHVGPRLPTNIRVDLIPSVSELTLVDLKSVQLYSTCENITTLSLIKLRITTSVRIFTKCPNLKKLHLEYLPKVQENFLAGVDSEDSQFPERTITMEHLEHFEWFVCRPEDIFVLSWQTALLTHLNLPALRRLKFDENMGDVPRLLPMVKAFFGRVAATVGEVEFSRVGVSGGNVFEDGIEVEEVGFEDCAWEFVDAVLERVNVPSRLPRLGTVTMRRAGRVLQGPAVQRYVRLLRDRARASKRQIILNGVAV